MLGNIFPCPRSLPVFLPQEIDGFFDNPTRQYFIPAERFARQVRHVAMSCSLFTAHVSSSALQRNKIT
jgi:hypothetical protein